MLPPTPTAAWEYFQRLNVRGTFEAVPFEAEDYLAKVSDPSDTEVRRVYEEGKDTYPLPDRPDPGFKRLKKVAVEYIEADLADFLPAAKAQITDEQVAAYYEANKGEFRNIELPGFDSLGTPGSGGAPTGDTQTPQTLDLPPLELETPADPAVADPATLEPSSTDSSVSPESPPATTESGDADAILPPDDIQPLQDDPADEGPKQNTAPEDVVEVEPREGTETDTVPPEAKQPGASEAVAEENTAEAVADDQIPPAQDETEAEADAETEATDEPAADESATEPTEGTTPGSTEDPLGDLPDEPGNNQASERPEYMPLEQVADDIRTTLARPIARQNMDEALNAVRSAMRTYYGKYIAWEVAQDQTKEKTEPPATPDLRAIASQYGLKYGQTPLVDVLQLQETDLVTGEPLYQISRAYDMNFVSFAQQAFSDTLNVFEARSIRGQAVDSEYVYWKTAEEKEFVPELDQVRDEVVRTIKMREAIELAKTAATEAAAELRKSAQRPSEAYRNDANRKVLVADSVTWMVSSGLPYLPPQINQIPGIRFPGNSLMKAVFSLNPGEYGVGVDQPENTAYAVAMISIESDMDQLRQTFLRSGPTTETLLLAQQEGQKHLQNWFDDLEKRLNIKWQRDPAPDSRRQ
jgi:hypothetical protein